MSDYERVVEAVEAARKQFRAMNILTGDHIEKVAELTVERFANYLLDALKERS